MRRVFRAAGADRRGAAALEFALLAPALIIVMLSLYDVTNAVIAWWQLSTAAGAIARMATTFAATTNNTNILAFQDATKASTAVFAVLPRLTTASAANFGVTMSSVVMSPRVPGCKANCTYVASTAWSAVLQGGGAKRPCGSLGSTPDGTPASSDALPLDAFTAAPLLVVDVSYNFTPLFNNLFGVGLRFMESAYMGLRTGTDAEWVRLTGPQATLAQAQCPGYKG